ncbi:AcrR family transcriptional regulator [Bosea sp. OAE752]|uniref:TetR/AcrR family transcriptional regulator n=1 Tax=Bosea spartocytisi TaxID=2773451 RepID=A0A927HZY8_9HYPH|nr:MULTISPECIES: TetR/AcrR family transcriptional regulator [Bosea]MBD3845802.1 TetR/AcrR family transcriptional regulator [Bosea spartocytisi]MCT4473095.1 TetR/AcrR family transcriptional regulator [Bosea spartocytisi]
MSDRSESSSALPLEDAKARVDQIADAALRLFARYGYKRSSMDDIAREAGLAKATLYLHFKGKDDVFRAMLNLIGRRVEARCREVVAMPGPFPERLAALLQAHHGQTYASFGTGEHLVELKAVMNTIATRELQAFEQIFARCARLLLQKAEARGEIAMARASISVDEWIAGMMFAATGAKTGTPPSCEAYAERLAGIARIFAAAVSSR